jgi:hypothetical protein
LLTAPTLSSLAAVLPVYGRFPFDRTLDAAREDIGSTPDLGNRDHAERLRRWLNDWLCRIGYPTGNEDLFADSLSTWWREFEQSLPPGARRLAELTDGQLSALTSAYGDLHVRPAAINRAGRTRRVGPTAAAKLLYFVRPEAVAAWDRAISMRTGGGQTASSFRRHLEICRGWAQKLEAEGRARGLEAEELGPYLGRPKSSVAKLLDEWLYATITGGFQPGQAA